MMRERVRAFFKRVPESELEQGFVRLASAVGYTIFLQFIPDSSGPWPYDKLEAYWVFAVYVLGSLVLIWAMLRNPRISVPRRYVGMVLDSGCAAWCIAIGAEYGIAVFANMLWNCLGFGLRFGKSYLQAAQVMNMFGFVLASSTVASHRAKGEPADSHNFP